ncbi:MAG: glycosyltransferase family 1 protein [Myxococcales bacterium]|nr:glycosyltransferase family 1 protein [Myxococcales bacterium]
MGAERLLTFNCHEAWVHQLGALGRPLDIIDGLPGRYTSRWDERMRPVPAGARLVSVSDVLTGAVEYDAIIGHNLSDLLAVRALEAPRVLVLHVTLEHRLEQAQFTRTPQELVRSIDEYLKLAGGVAVAVSDLKARSWGLAACSVVESAANVAEYLPWTGELEQGLRVANQIQARRKYLAWELHERAFAGVPLRIFGHNPDMPGVKPPASWAELKLQLSRHRFFVHTADPSLEDGFNMALMEALAAGLPVIGNRHPTSPVEDGVSGMLSDDPALLALYARRLLVDRPLAERMSTEARLLAERRFSPARFIAGMERAVLEARRRFEAR